MCEARDGPRTKNIFVTEMYRLNYVRSIIPVLKYENHQFKKQLTRDIDKKIIKTPAGERGPVER